MFAAEFDHSFFISYHFHN